MNMLATIAWRNIWRNPRRSWVLISAIAIGVFCFVGAMAYADGLITQMVNSAIELQGGHVQVSAAGYHDNPTVRTLIPDVQRVEQAIAPEAGVQAAPQVVMQGMANSAEQAVGVQILGVDPVREAALTSIDDVMIEGPYLPADQPNAVLVGTELADRLNVRLGEKIVLMANDLDNEVSAGAFRIAGLFRTSSAEFDKTHVFIRLTDAQALLGYAPDQVSTVTLHLPPGADLDATAERVRRRLGSANLDVLTWRERAPLLVMMQDMYDYVSLYFVIILFAAVAFTIVNSFLMVIFERIREIGIMAAGGVKPRQIRRMLYLEALFILLMGIALGGGLVAALIVYWQSVGLDLSAFAEGLSALGTGTVIYPHLDPQHLLTGLLGILAMVLLAVLYPAYRASRFDIVEAINHV